MIDTVGAAEMPPPRLAVGSAVPLEFRVVGVRLVPCYRGAKGLEFCHPFGWEYLVSRGEPKRLGVQVWVRESELFPPPVPQPEEGPDIPAGVPGRQTSNGRLTMATPTPRLCKVCHERPAGAVVGATRDNTERGGLSDAEEGRVDEPGELHEPCPGR